MVPFQQFVYIGRSSLKNSEHLTHHFNISWGNYFSPHSFKCHLPFGSNNCGFFFFSRRSQEYVGVKQMHCVWSCLCGFGHHCPLCWVLWLKTCVSFCPTQIFLYLGVLGAHTHFICFFFSWGHVSSFWNVIVASSGPRSWVLVQSSTMSLCFIRSLSIHLLLVILNTTQYEHYSDFQ